MTARKTITPGKAEWNFRQHNLEVISHYQRVPPAPAFGKALEALKSRISRTVRGRSPCREGVLANLRCGMWDALTGPAGGGAGWRDTSPRKLRFGIDLEEEALKQPGQTVLRVHAAHSCKRSDRAYQEFVWLSDATVGLLNVLLNPNRYTGTWWRTHKEEVQSDHDHGMLNYYGVDNTLLYHPALVSLNIGLLRQCVLIAGRGLARAALANVKRPEVVKALNQSDAEQALELFKKMRPWVEVTSQREHRAINFPVPKGSFSKLLNLHQALYIHGFEKTFNADLITAWNLKGGLYGLPCNGIHDYMGQQGENDRGERIKALAKKSHSAG